MSRNHISVKISSAVAFLQKGEFDQAEAQCRAVLRILPKHFDAVHILGVIHAQRKHYELAMEYFGRALMIAPNHAEAQKNLRIVVTQHCRDQIQLALPLHQAGQFDQAEQIYQSILTVDENHVDALQLSGTIAAQRNLPIRALELLDRAIAIKPDCAEAYSNRGYALKELKQLDAAIASYDRAIAIKPDYAEAYSNRGYALQALKQLDAAVASYDRAIAIKPDYAEAYSNRGYTLKELKQLDAAIASYDRAIAIKPDYAEAYWNKSLTLLLFGRFDHGWPLYEWRWEREDQRQYKHKRDFTQPLWLGEDQISNKTLLLHSEQGLGDSLQFCRYAKLAADRGARVIVEVPESLIGLLQGLEGVSEWVVKGAKLPAFDVHCPLLSLPLAFKTDLTNIPARTAYLHSDPSKLSAWQEKLGAKTKLRVGIAWSGNAGHKNDHNRSLALAEFIAHLPPDCEVVSLQKELRTADQLVLAANAHVRHFGSELKDFSDTAALCDAMDVVVCVDTSVAHLSGALGKPTWILLPHIPDWRWLLDRDDSPWYPSAKLYRQKTAGIWVDVLDLVKADLGKLASSGSPRG